MGWPKGKPRVGHVKSDGTPHLPKGGRLKAIRKDPEPYMQTAKPDKALRVIKGETGRPIIEPCPNCGFAYADGGYCDDCGWTRHDDNCPHCKRLK